MSNLPIPTLKEIKCANQTFLIELSQYFESELGKRIRSGCDSDQASKDVLKLVDRYIKVVESLNRMTKDAPPTEQSSPRVIPKLEAERKSGHQTHSEFLAFYANLRRQAQASAPITDEATDV